MEILRSGSFVNLDDKTKIEQLVFTSRELARAAVQSPEFGSESGTKQELALQIWKGAEYLCRDNESELIKNIFLSNFLKELSLKTPIVTSPVGSAVAIVPDTPSFVSASQEPQLPVRLSVEPPVVPSPTTNTMPDPPQDSIAPRAQLAVVGSKPNLIVELDEELETPRSYSDECIPEGERAADSFNEEATEIEELPSETAPFVYEEVKVEISAITETSLIPEPVPLAVSELSSGTEHVNDVDDSSDGESVESIVIAEKEPYNFEGCTVTAVIQLLPETAGVRKCVVSVRTHDFTPLVAMEDAAISDLLPQLAGTLRRSFELYRDELPAKAADKMKKDKPAAKKTAKAAKPTATPAKTTAVPATIEAAGKEQDQQGLFGT